MESRIKWSGFITKNFKDRIGVDAYLMSGIFPENIQFNLNISVLANPEDVVGL